MEASKEADNAAAHATEPPSGDADEVREAAANAAKNAPAKRKNRGNIRKRPADEDEADADGGGVVAKAQKQRDAPLAFSTRREDKAETFKFESSGLVQQRTDGGATRQLETETEADRDARAIRDRIKAVNAEGGAALDDVYRGQAGYRDFRAGFRRENAGTEMGGGGYGPLRASANVRMSIRVDYQPDICKDYKETGYCGFGDSCKFLHDRGDYKAGWEIDREWEEKQKQQRERILNGWKPEDEEDEEEDEEDDGIPFACLICRRPWAECQDPVVTKCKHYFCEQCALQHNAKSKLCFECEQPTSGIFNVAQDVIKKEKARKRQNAE